MRIKINKLIIIVMLLSGLVAKLSAAEKIEGEISSSTTVETTQDATTSGTNEIDGSQYVLNCSECHGYDGNSPLSVWPNLAGLNENYIVKQLNDFKTGRRNHQQMKEVVSMIPSNQVFEALAKYFSEQVLHHLPAKNIGNNKLVNLELGKELYTGKRIEYGIPGCTNCHGVKGMGGADGKYPRLAGQHKLYIVNQMKLFRAKERTNDVPAMMQNISMLMDDEDIESVAAYIESLGSNK